MRKEDCFYLGKIVRKHSYRGEVMVKLDTDQPQLYENLESVFVAVGNSLVPFFIASSRLHKSALLRVKFDDIDDEAGADEIMGAALYLPLTQLPELKGKKFYYHEIIGFRVIDHQYGNLGKVTSVVDTTAQAILKIDKEGKEVLIPVSEHIIDKVDRKARKVFVTTPEGLVDLYLGDSAGEK